MPNEDCERQAVVRVSQVEVWLVRVRPLRALDKGFNSVRIKVRAGIVLKQNIFRISDEQELTKNETPEQPKKSQKKSKNDDDGQDIDTSTLDELKKHATE
jgi:hypothetical protein